MVLMFISQMAKDIEHLKNIYCSFVRFLFQNYPFSLLLHALTGRSLISTVCSLYILDTNSWPDVYLTEIVLSAVYCFFSLLIVPFAVQKLFNLSVLGVTLYAI